MNKNYMTCPMKNMRITCRYDEASHRKHCINVSDGLVDYPIDDGGKDTGRDPIYCPCDEMKVTAIRGVGNSSVTNTIWLVSTSAVVTPTFTDIAFMTLTHPNDSDFATIKVGDIFKRGEIICYEGTDSATSNHIHLTCGRGNSSSWKQNANGAWIMDGNSYKPEDVFYIDRNFTTELWGGYLIWKDLPEVHYVGNPVSRNTNVNQIEVLVDNLNARSDASTDSMSYGYLKKGFYDVVSEQDRNDYHWVKVESYWIATKEGWTKMYPKTTTTCEEKLKELEASYPRLIFTCNQTGKYLIYLQEGSQLYLR